MKNKHECCTPEGQVPRYVDCKGCDKKPIETMSKQTAVSQIFAQIKAGRKDTKFWNDSMLVDWLLEQEERYKQMEKEEILDAWTDGYSCGMYQEGLGIDYYNETYLGIIKEEE